MFIGDQQVGKYLEALSSLVGILKGKKLKADLFFSY